MSGILKVSDATVLAIHAVIFIANNPEKMVTAKEIATYHNASENHLSKVLQRLSRAGYVRSIRGPGGGFELARDPENITLREIYDLFEGPLYLNNCLFLKTVCEYEVCVFGNLLSEINALVKDYLDTTSLKDVTKKISK